MGIPLSLSIFSSPSSPLLSSSREIPSTLWRQSRIPTAPLADGGIGCQASHQRPSPPFVRPLPTLEARVHPTAACPCTPLARGSARCCEQGGDDEMFAIIIGSCARLLQRFLDIPCCSSEAACGRCAWSVSRDSTAVGSRRGFFCRKEEWREGGALQREPTQAVRRGKLRSHPW